MVSNRGRGRNKAVVRVIVPFDLGDKHYEVGELVSPELLGASVKERGLVEDVVGFDTSDVEEVKEVEKWQK